MSSNCPPELEALPPQTLRYWREYFATRPSELAGPDGLVHQISLAPWDDADEDTLISIYVQWRDPALVHTLDPARVPPPHPTPPAPPQH